MFRKITMEITFTVTVDADENTEVAAMIDDMEYELILNTTHATMLDSSITRYLILDSK